MTVETKLTRDQTVIFLARLTADTQICGTDEFSVTTDDSDLSVTFCPLTPEEN